MQEERLKTEPPLLIEALDARVVEGDEASLTLDTPEKGELTAEPVEALKQMVSEAKLQHAEPASTPVSSAANASAHNPVNPPSRYSGLARHKRIVASCLALSLGVVGLSLFDLNSLIGQKCEIDAQMKIRPETHLIELSPNLVYGYGSHRYYREAYTPVLKEGLTQVEESTLLGQRVAMLMPMAS